MKNYMKGIGRSIGIILICVFIQAVFRIVLPIVSVINKNFNEGMIYIPCQITVILFFYLMFKKTEDNLIDRCSFKKINIKCGLRVILISIGISLLSTVLVEMLNSFFPSYGEAMKYFRSSNVLLIFINIVIIAPIFEEILFRGIIFYDLRKYVNIYSAIIIQAVLFAIIHGNILQGIYTFVLGLALGVIRYWTNSLWSTIIVHMLFNFFGRFVNMHIEFYPKLIAIYVILGFVLISVPLYYMFKDFKNKNNTQIDIVN